MQKVNQIIPKALEKDSKESAKKPGTDEMVEISYLFDLLAIEYPFFLPKNDEDLLRKQNMWISLLRPYDRNQRMDAVKRCLSHFTNKGGPSVADFMGLLKTEAAHQDFVRLPAPEPTKSVARAALDNLKRILS